MANKPITLRYAYCEPTTEAEWDMLPDRAFWFREDNKVFSMTHKTPHHKKRTLKLTVKGFSALLKCAYNIVD